MKEDYAIEKILEKKKFGGECFYLVKWQNYTYDEATWEPKNNLREATDALEEFRTCHPLEKLKKKVKKYASNPSKKKLYEAKFKEMKSYIDKLSQKKQAELDKTEGRRSGSRRSGLRESSLLQKKRVRDSSDDTESELAGQSVEYSPEKKTDWVGNDEKSQEPESLPEIKEIVKEVVQKNFLVSWQPGSDGSKKEPSMLSEKEMERKFPKILAEYYGSMSKKLTNS